MSTKSTDPCKQENRSSWLQDLSVYAVEVRRKRLCCARRGYNAVPVQCLIEKQLVKEISRIFMLCSRLFEPFRFLRQQILLQEV